MGVIAGLLLGLGLLLVWDSCWHAPAKTPESKVSDLLIELHTAGFTGVSIRMFVFACALLSLVCATIAFFISTLPAFALVAAFVGAGVLPLVVQHRARTARRRRREVWPDAIEHILSGIRAGLSLPEALVQVGERGPIELRHDFRLFAHDYRASGNFDSSLLVMKQRLADPTADRVVEALRLTRAVGGNELGSLMESLNKFLRQDIRTRGELEARQSWTIGGARVAVAAPWLILGMLVTRPEAARAFNTPAGTILILGGAAVTVIAYFAMLKVGSLPRERRVLA